MKFSSVLIAIILFTFGQAEAADYLRWVPAKPPQSCATMCDSALGYDAVYNKDAHKPGTLPTYVCSSLDGVPGANHTYSQDAARLCHLQSAGKGFGSSDYSCLCAPKL